MDRRILKRINWDQLAVDGSGQQKLSLTAEYTNAITLSGVALGNMPKYGS